MNALVKLPKVRNGNIYDLREFHDDVESNIRGLPLLGIESTHGALITTLILEKLSQEIKLIAARNVAETWDLSKTWVLPELINQELGAREVCT